MSESETPDAFVLERQRRRAANAALLLILILAVVLRLIRLDSSFWIDEVQAYRAASQDFWRVLTFRSYPLNYLQAFVALQFGDGEAALRFPSVLLGIVTVAFTYAWGKSVFGHGAGLLTALLVATSPLHVLVSQDARYYALYILSGAAMLWFGAQAATRGRRRDWFLFLLASVLGMLNHPFFMVFLGCATLGAVAWIAVTRKIPGIRPKVARIGACCLCVAAAASVFLGACALSQSGPFHMINDLASGAASAFSEDATPTVPDLSGQHIAQENPSRDWRPFRLEPWQYLAYFQSSFLPNPPRVVLGMLVGLGVWGLIRVFRKAPALGWMFVACLVLVPLPFMLFPWRHHVIVLRYYTILLAIVVFLVAAGIDAAARWTAVWTRRMGSRRTNVLAEMNPAVIKGVLLAVALLCVALSTTQAYMGLLLKVGGILPGFPEPDDLSAGMLVLLGLGSVALFGLAAWLAVRLARLPAIRRQAGAFTRRPARVRVTATLLLLAVMAPSTGKALAAHYNQPGWWDRDWKGCARNMAATMTSRDIVVFFVRDRLPHHRTLPLDHYLERYVENGPVVVPRLERHFAQKPDVSLVREVASENPDVTIWVVALLEAGWTPELSALDACTQGETHFGHVLLRYLGEPTTNLVVDGGFEASPGSGTDARIAGAEEAYEDTRCAMLTSDEPGFHAITRDIQSAGELLGTAKPFTLSMMLKYRTDILRFPKDFENEDAPIGGCVSLVGKDPQGEPVERVLHRCRGARDWHHVSIPIDPAADLPPDTSSVAVQIGVYGGTGTLWADNVQMETKDHPTPFVDGVRPPHDTYFAGRELEDNHAPFAE